jgi:hypothetical protein
MFQESGVLIAPYPIILSRKEHDAVLDGPRGAHAAFAAAPFGLRLLRLPGTGTV